MIVGFGGRIGSGKTVLAKRMQEKFGGVRVFFAIPLKDLCKKLLGLNTGTFERMKRNNDEINFKIDGYSAKIISDETGIGMDVVAKWAADRVFRTPRDMAQQIGTDLIRTYNQDWHVNRIREMVKEYDGHNIFFDDVRFPNEVRLIKELGGDMWYVVRPTLSNVSNHESETSLTWHDCYPNIIVNDGTLEWMVSNWLQFADDYGANVQKRNDLIIAEAAMDEMLISNDMFTYRDIRQRLGDVRSAEPKDGFVCLTYDDGSVENVSNALIIEDIKSIL